MVYMTVSNTIFCQSFTHYTRYPCWDGMMVYMTVSNTIFCRSFTQLKTFQLFEVFLEMLISKCSVKLLVAGRKLNFEIRRK